MPENMVAQHHDVAHGYPEEGHLSENLRGNTSLTVISLFERAYVQSTAPLLNSGLAQTLVEVR